MVSKVLPVLARDSRGTGSETIAPSRVKTGRIDRAFEFPDPDLVGLAVVRAERVFFKKISFWRKIFGKPSLSNSATMNQPFKSKSERTLHEFSIDP